jgi:glycosyltransferase involved in cell wall biosynthesis
MIVGWLADAGNQDGSIGGAELTQQEFRAAAPEDVEVWSVPPDDLEKLERVDAACVFNCVTYPEGTIRALSGKKVVRYWNDVAPHGSPKLTGWLVANATSVFCSPIHYDRFPHGEDFEHELIPPPVDLQPFRDAAENAQERSGAVSVAAWMNPGKAPHLAAEWARGNGGLDFYGNGPYAPVGTKAVPYDDMPEILARYEKFVFLPSALEPFCRLVAEAHAAGCKVITNNLVGARYWLENDPGRIESAADDFWKLVLRG